MTAESKADGVSLLSAGVAFYALLALVPALIAFVSLYGLIAKPDEVERQIRSTLSAAPREVRDLVTAQLQSIVDSAGGGAVLGIVLGFVIALWSASSGVSHLIEAVNRAYDEVETRRFVVRKGIALAFTIGAILFVLTAFGLIALLPPLLAKTGLGPAGRVAAGVLRWILLLAGMVIGLALLYRYGPDRDDPKWRWTSPGALSAAVAWVIGSLLFSLYTANFAKYNETYGSLAAVVVTMLWLYLTALVVVVGAEINAEVERQTIKDTTRGPDLPMGWRSAVAADTLGPTADQLHAAAEDAVHPDEALCVRRPGSGYAEGMTSQPSSNEADPEKESTPAGVVRDLERKADEIGASTESAESPPSDPDSPGATVDEPDPAEPNEPG